MRLSLRDCHKDLAEASDVTVASRMKTVLARFAFLEQNIAIRISGDGRRLVGFHFANVFNDIMDGGRMNLTISRIPNDIGSCNETSYTGPYEALYKNQSDVSFFLPSNSACDRMSAFEAGFPFMDTPSDIFMLKDLLPKSRSHTRSLVRNVPLIIMVIILLLSLVVHRCLIWFRNMDISRRILLKSKAKKFFYLRSRPRHQGYKILWLMLAVSCRQSRLLRSRSCRSRLMFLAYCWMMMMFLIFMSSFFKTSLIVKQSVEHIETLEDLAQSERYSALFLKEWHLHHWIEPSNNPILRLIWSKATNNTKNISAALVDSSSGSSRLPDVYGTMQQLKRGRTLLSAVNVNRFLRDAYCYVYEPAEERSTIVHTSRTSFLPFLSMAIFRRGAPQEIKDRINWIFMNYNEHGLHDFYKKNPLGLLRKTSIQRECYRRIEEEEQDEKKSEEIVHSITLQNLTELNFWCIKIIALAFVILLIENLRHWQIRTYYSFLKL